MTGFRNQIGRGLVRLGYKILNKRDAFEIARGDDLSLLAAYYGMERESDHSLRQRLLEYIARPTLK